MALRHDVTTYKLQHNATWHYYIMQHVSARHHNAPLQHNATWHYASL